MIQSRVIRKGEGRGGTQRRGVTNVCISYTMANVREMTNC